MRKLCTFFDFTLSFLMKNRCFQNQCILSRNLSSSNFEVASEVSEALQNGDPVVALESTIITHGMPYPENFRVACEVTDIVKKQNAVPATIGVIAGKIYVGMNSEQLETLAFNSKDAVKISRRDLPYVLSKHLTGGTTVAGTMVLAHKLGIKIFATGGIGGVHRNGESSMDVSCDLTELARTPMTVISAGIKSILDIGRTLEYLETQGVCVGTFSESTEFPAFFSEKSGYHVPYNFLNPKEVAHLIVARDELKLESGILIAVPIPNKFASDGQKIENAIQKAIKESEFHNITGNDVTPYILKRVNELTHGSSLKSNIELIKNNALVASQIAVELSKNTRYCNKMDNSSPASYKSALGDRKSDHSFEKNKSGRPVVIGGSILDFVATVLEDKIETNASTHRGKIQCSPGGVGRNMAECLTLLDFNPILISAVGVDDNADSLMDFNRKMDTKGIKRLQDTSTATSFVILDKHGDFSFGIGDMEIHDQISKFMVSDHEDAIKEAPIVAIDGNLPVETIDYTIDLCKNYNVPVWFEPTDIHKASKPFINGSWKKLTYASPNLNELRIMHKNLSNETTHLKSVQSSDKDSLENILQESIHLSLPLMDHMSLLVVTLGRHGVLLITKTNRDSFSSGLQKFKRSCQKKFSVRAVHYQLSLKEKIISVSGAGDSLAAAMMGALIRNLEEKQIAFAGLKAAHFSLGSHRTIPQSISRSLVYEGDLNQLQTTELYF